MTGNATFATTVAAKMPTSLFKSLESPQNSFSFVGCIYCSSKFKLFYLSDVCRVWFMPQTKNLGLFLQQNPPKTARATASEPCLALQYPRFSPVSAMELKYIWWLKTKNPCTQLALTKMPMSPERRLQDLRLDQAILSILFRGECVQVHSANRLQTWSC